MALDNKMYTMLCTSDQERGKTMAKALEVLDITKLGKADLLNLVAAFGSKEKAWFEFAAKQAEEIKAKDKTLFKLAGSNSALKKKIAALSPVTEPEPDIS
jgi:uncharacterized protein YeaO (DUF488 family)